MLKPNEIEKASTMLDEPMRALENQIMEDIVRRIKINGEITRSADWQLHRFYEMGMSKADIKQALKDNLDFDDKDILELYKKVYKAGYSHDEEIYLKKGLTQVPFEDNIPLQQMISAVAEQTANEIKNISQSLGFAVKQPDGTLKFQDVADFYQQTLDNSILGIANGVIDYNTAIKNAVSTMTNSGLRTVDYASGWSNRVYVAGRRAIVTGMSQLTAKVNEDNAKALETEYFEVTWHSGARPSHQEWQGKVYTKEQLETVCGLGTVTGLCGANCYHDYYPFIPGISERTYTDEQLAEMNAEDNRKREYQGKEYTKYEALQRQRKLETAIRTRREQIHLLQLAEVDEDDIINARCRYQGTLQEYNRFSREMDLPVQHDRIYVDGWGNIGVGKVTGGSGKKSPIELEKVIKKPVEKVVPKEPKYKFVEATTIEEAEKFATDNGVRHADYSDLPLESANLFNRAIMTIPEDIRPVFVGSSTKLKKALSMKSFSRKDKDFFGVHMNVLQLYYGEYPNLVYDFEGGNVVAISSRYKTANKIREMKVKSNKVYASKHDGHTQFFNENGDSTFFHEIGHVYEENKGLPEGFKEDAQRWYKESKCDMLKDPSEAWAEAWGAYHTQNPDLPDYIAKYIDDVTQTPIDKSEKSGIMKLYRKKDNKISTEKFISDKRIDELTIEARLSGAKIIKNDPWFNARLKSQNASAVTYGDVIVFGKNVTVSDVIEETYHYKQNVNGLNDDKPLEIRRVMNEIDAKKYLIDNADKFKIPRNETDLTKRQLNSYEDELKRLIEKTEG